MAQHHALKGANGWFVIRESEILVKRIKKEEAEALAAALNEQDQRRKTQ